MKAETLITLQNWILKIGVRASILLVLIGGCVYLYYFGSQPHVMPATIVEKQQHILEFKVIEYGFCSLIAIQFIRLFFVCLIFLIKRNYSFMLISLFVLVFILFSMFSPFIDIKLFNKT